MFKRLFRIEEGGERVLTYKDIHLEDENINVETVSSDPRILVQDITEDGDIGCENQEKHHC